MLAAGSFPRHRTICDFRAFHLKELSELFVQVVTLAREMGLADAGYRSEDNLRSAPIELVVALGREGTAHTEIDAKRNPHRAAMAVS